MSALYQWFMDMDLNDYDWIKRRPITDAYKEMCNLYSPIEALFFEEFYDKDQWHELDMEGNKDSSITIPMPVLFSMYEGFCKRNRFLKDDTKATSSRSFIAKLVDLELPITRLKTNGYNSIRMTPQEVYDYIDKKRWINGYRDDEQEVENVDKGEDATEDYFN